VPDDEFLTVREIAERLKLNQQTIRNMIDRGELGHVRVGRRRVRVRQSQLDALRP
jgi:excisionase family DNA binding protein